MELREAVFQVRERPPESIRGAFDERIHIFRGRCEAMRTSTHKKTQELVGEFLNDRNAIFAVLDDPRWPTTTLNASAVNAVTRPGTICKATIARHRQNLAPLSLPV
jgi:hypothetical protein